MRAVGYIRVSTEDQVRDGVSLDAQQAKLEAYCLVKDWTLHPLLRGEGYTAKHLKRPGLEALLALVEAGQVEVVIVSKLDRLTRSVVDLDRLMKRFERRHVALVSLQASLDATTATGRLMMNLLASVSQWEREVISEHTRDALAHLTQAIATQLNREDVSTLSGRGSWQKGAVANLLAEAEGAP